VFGNITRYLKTVVN